MGAQTYTYPGATIPFLRKRVLNVLKPSNEPQTIHLLGGGNDCTESNVKVRDVKNEYSRLLDDVKQRCPNSTIFINQIPPRPDHNTAISALNSRLKHLCDPKNDIYFVDACPKTKEYFIEDLVHFNGKGVSFYADRLVDAMTNFHSLHLNPKR